MGAKGEQIHRGTVKWFNEDKGFGFIESEDFDEDVFVHYSELDQDGFKSLRENEEVEFNSTINSEGPAAQNVKRL